MSSNFIPSFLRSGSIPSTAGLWGRPGPLLIPSTILSKAEFSTFSNSFFQGFQQGRKEAVLTLNCDEPEVKEMLANINTSELKMLIGNNRIIVIDEAQRVSEIGLTLKRPVPG